MSSFCVDILFQKKLQSQIIRREKVQKTLLYKKVVHKIMVKLTTKQVLASYLKFQKCKVSN